MKTKINDVFKQFIHNTEPIIEKPKVKSQPQIVNNRRTLLGEFHQDGFSRKNSLLTQFSFLQTQNNINSFPSTLDPADVEEEANQMIADNGGRDNLNTEALGEDLAEIAKTDPARAWAIAQVILGDQVDTNGNGIVKDHDKDAIVSSMINNLSDEELANLGNTPEGRALLQRAQQHMYAGNSSENEKAIADRIQQQGLQDHMIFSDVYEGISGFPETVPFDENASPEDAALAINATNGYSTNENSDDLSAFTFQLEQHKDDPEWLARFYSALGSERAGELIDAATSSGTYNSTGVGGDSADMHQNAETIRQSFETMFAAGLLQQADLEALVKDINDNPYVALEIFGKSDNIGLQNAFINAVIKSGSDQTKAAVVTMISQMPLDRQAQILGALDQASLDKLMTGAMRGAGEIPDLSSLIEGNPNGNETIKIGDVTGLMTSAAENKFPTELKQRLFLATSKALSDNEAYENFDNNNELRQAMNQIFLDETPPTRTGADNLFTLLASETNGRIAPGEQTALAGFFAFSVFSPNQTDNSFRLEARITELFTNAGSNMTNSVGAFGLTAEAYATMFGGIFGSLEEGLKLSQDRHESDEAGRKKAIGFFVNIVTSMIPGVTEYIPANFDVFSSPVGTIQSQLEGKVEQGVINFINNLFTNAQDGFLNDSDLKSILEGFADVLPSNILGSFIDGYDGV